MNSPTLAQLFSAIVFVALSVFLIDPMGLWMPTMAQMTMLALVVIAFGVFVIFLVHESGGDERDESNRAFAGRVAFLAGSVVLLVGIVVESLAHALDTLLVVALVAM